MLDPRLQILADNMKRLIEGSRYRAADVARLIDVDRSIVGRWITGERKPTMDNLIAFADLMGVEMKDLWTGVEAIPATPEQRLMVEIMSSMSVAEQQTWVAATAAAFRKKV